MGWGGGTLCSTPFPGLGRGGEGWGDARRTERPSQGSGPGPDPDFPPCPLSWAPDACRRGLPSLKGQWSPSPTPATGGGWTVFPLPVQSREKLTLQAWLCSGKELVSPACPPSLTPSQVPDPGGGGPTPNSEAPSPPSPSAPGPWVGSAPSLTLPRPAPIGRLRRRSGHFLLGRRRRLKLWRGKKSYWLLATLPAPHPTPPPATPPSSRLPTELFSNFCDS